uniref:translation initiation factor 2 n=1 Tax=Porphyridium aerugineum TaxID=2792 RepID=UPI001FCE1FFE|nr:translation initiation factor 2 [Porphyridium aerugineum]UNJ17838.1 translation initiation factor 2 [Porphyridium aerugineum]
MIYKKLQPTKNFMIIRYATKITYNDMILDLENPKIFIRSKNNRVINLETENLNGSLLIDTNIDTNDNKQNKKNITSKHKQKDYVEDTTDVETKKNQIKKNIKRNKNSISIDDEDDPIINSEIFQSTNIKNVNNIDISLMRPPKPDNKLVINSKSKIKHTHNSNANKKKSNENPAQIDTINHPLELFSPIKIIDFAKLLNISEQEIIKFLFMKGIIATINQIIDIETSKLIASNFGIEIITNRPSTVKDKNDNINKENHYNKQDNEERRAPVVTIMGHVDHGKTTLLDRIRQTNVAENEAGKITQGIGAYEVFIDINNQNEKIVFLDTPGHEAFSSMRSRGANLTDIAVLIIAADDGIKPQTIEAIEHIKKVNSSLIVAVNKIDKKDANFKKAIEQLTEYNLIAEELGGNIKVIPISALTGQNIDLLLESIIKIAQGLNLYCNPNQKAIGSIIESHLDKNQGPSVTLIVENGTLNVGDIIICGPSYGKIRSMVNSNGEKIKSASASSVVVIWGLSEVTKAGEKFQIVDKEKEARLIAEINKQDHYKEHELSSSRIMINSLQSTQNLNNLKKLDIILKTDTQGSLEAILNILSQIPQGKVQLQVIYDDIGDIKENDIELAHTTNAKIISFNTDITNNAKNLAARYKTIIKPFNVIYDLLNEVEKMMKDLVDIEYKEEKIGEAEVKNTFPLSKGTVAGCYVDEGKLQKGSKIKVVRNNENIYEGELNSLKRVKEDIEEIGKGNECGIVINEFHGWQKKDRIIAYILEPQPASLI